MEVPEYPLGFMYPGNLLMPRAFAGMVQLFHNYLPKSRASKGFQVIDHGKERPLLLSELARELDISYYTVRAWVTDGRWNRSHTRRVKLETIRLPSGQGTTREAYHRMIEDMNRGE